MNCIVVLDVRSLQLSPHSGVGRFTQCLAEGLADVAQRQQQLQIVLAGTRMGTDKERSPGRNKSVRSLFERPLLPVSHVEFGNAHSWWVRKPRLLWSTLLFFAFVWHLRRSRSSSSFLVWFAPDNIDRPLTFALPMLRWRNQFPQKIVQIVHDLIPLRYPNRENRILRLQMRLLLGPVFRNGIRFAPISHRTEHDLGEYVPRASVTKNLITNRVGRQFASDLSAVNVFDASQLEQQIRDQISGLMELLESHDLLDNVSHQVRSDDLPRSTVRFLLGVGRDESYKSWSKAMDIADMTGKIAPDFRHNVWFLHVCTAASEGSFYSDLENKQEKSVTLGVCVIYPRLRVLRIRDISDRGLACLYRFADALIHLSMAEGYGLPLAEAYLAGLPVFAVQSNGFTEVLSRLLDQSAVHFFDASPDYELLAEALQPEVSLDKRLGKRAHRSRARLSDAMVHDLLLSNAAMGVLAHQVIHEVTAGIN